MEGFYLLLAFSAAMFWGSFLVGLIPLVCPMSEGRIRLLSFFGAGLLVGTALSVIVPEGVESIYLVENARVSMLHKVETINHLENLESSKKNETDQEKLDRIKRHAGFENYNIAKDMGDSHDHSSSADSVDLNYINKAVGFSLIIGFLFMLIVDQVTRSASSRGSERLRYKMTATIGLVVHAAADGVAVGSAAATNHTDVQSVVFLAVILHKAPAAIGLVSFLLMEGVERLRIRRHLFVFSAAAPVAALFTYYLIAVIVRESMPSNSSTGILLLFSAGTFLYVATVHILPELVNSNSNYQLISVDGVAQSHKASGSPLAITELLSIIVGAIVPALISSRHSH